MWKYRCKSHLIAMSVAFVVGLALSAVVFSSGVDLNSDMFSSALSQAPGVNTEALNQVLTCLLYTSPSPRDLSTSRMPSSA